MTGYVLSLRQRERDILIEFNDGTFLTTIQPVEDVERAFAEVNARAIAHFHAAADQAITAAASLEWRDIASRIDPAPKVQGLPAMRLAAE